MSGFSSLDGSSAIEDLSSLNVTFSYLNPSDHRLYHEVSPKSNYTYAYSGSYQTDLLHKHWRSPNLSRSPLHCGSLSAAATRTSSDVSPASLATIVGSSTAASVASSSSSSAAAAQHLRRRSRQSASTLSLTAAESSDRVLRSRCRAEGGVHCGHVDCRIHGHRATTRSRFSRLRDDETVDEHCDAEEEKGTMEAIVSRSYGYSSGYGYSGIPGSGSGSSGTTAGTSWTATTTKRMTTTAASATQTIVTMTRRKIVATFSAIFRLVSSAGKFGLQLALAPVVSATAAVRDVFSASSGDASFAASSTVRQQARASRRERRRWLCSPWLLLLLVLFALLAAWWHILLPLLSLLRDGNYTVWHSPAAGIILGGGDRCCDAARAEAMELRMNRELSEMRALLNLFAKQREDDDAHRRLLLQQMSLQLRSTSSIGEVQNDNEHENSTGIDRQISLLRQTDAEQLKLTTAVSDRISKLEKAQLDLVAELRQQVLQEISSRLQSVTLRVVEEEKRARLAGQKSSELENKLASLEGLTTQYKTATRESSNRLLSVEKLGKSLSESIALQQQLQRDSDEERQKLSAEVQGQFSSFEKQIEILQQTVSEQKLIVGTIGSRLSSVESSASESATAEKEQRKLFLDLESNLKDLRNLIALLQQSDSEHKKREAMFSDRLDIVDKETAAVAKSHEKSNEEHKILADRILKQINDQQKQLAASLDSESDLRKQSAALSDRLDEVEKSSHSNAALILSAGKFSELNEQLQRLQHDKTEQSKHFASVSDRLATLESELASLLASQSKVANELKKANEQQNDRLNSVEIVAADTISDLRNSNTEKEKQITDIRQQIADYQKQLTQLKESELELSSQNTRLSEHIESVVSLASSNYSISTAEQQKLSSELSEQQKLLLQIQQAEIEQVTVVNDISERLASVESALSSLKASNEDEKRQAAIIDLRKHLSDHQKHLEQLQLDKSEQANLVAAVTQRLASVESTLNSPSEAKQESSENAQPSSQFTNTINQQLGEHNEKISKMQSKLDEYETRISAFYDRFGVTEKLVAHASKEADSAVAMVKQLNKDAVRMNLIADLRQQLVDFQQQLTGIRKSESEHKALVVAASERLAALDASVSASELSNAQEFENQRKQRAELEQRLSDYQLRLFELTEAEKKQQKFASDISDHLVAIESSSASTKKQAEEGTKVIAALQQQVKDYHEQLVLLKQVDTEQHRAAANLSLRLEYLESSISLAKETEMNNLGKIAAELSNYQEQLAALKEAEVDVKKLAVSVSDRLAAVESTLTATSSKSQDVAEKAKLTIELQQQLDHYQQQLVLLKESEADQRKLASNVSERLVVLQSVVSEFTKLESESRLKQVDELKQQLTDHQRQLDALKKLEVAYQTLAINITDRLNIMETTIKSSREKQIDEQEKLTFEIKQQLSAHQQQIVLLQKTKSDMKLRDSTDSNHESDGRHLIAAIQQQLLDHEKQLVDLKSAASMSAEPAAASSKVCNETDDIKDSGSLHRQLAEYRRRLRLVARLASAGCSGRQACQCNCTQPVSSDPFPNGVPDFALHSAGAYVVGTRCTVAYNGQASVVELFGFPVLAFSRSPTTALEPDTNLGECWAFQGFPGHLIVRLAVPARISSVTVDHAAREVSYNASMSSAPRNFTVYGLDSGSTPFEAATPLGSFVYNAETGPAAQTFHLNATTDRYYEYVELAVESNHGNEIYTCLYRFRVHGLA